MRQQVPRHSHVQTSDLHSWDRRQWVSWKGSIQNRTVSVSLLLSPFIQHHTQMYTHIQCLWLLSVLPEFGYSSFIYHSHWLHSYCALVEKSWMLTSQSRLKFWFCCFLFIGFFSLSFSILFSYWDMVLLCCWPWTPGPNQSCLSLRGAGATGVHRPAVSIYSFK